MRDTLPALTSLRFFAALMVFFSHLHFLRESPSREVSELFSNVLYEGYIGVTFFFILSGFILSYAYQERSLGGGEYSNYIISRVARIFPLHLVTLVICVPVMLFASESLSLANLIANGTLTQAFFSDSTIYFSFNAPAWSLSVEMFFYLFFPFLVVIRSWWLVLLLALVIMLKLLLSITISSEAIHYYMYISPPLRVADFIAGLLLFRLYSAFKIESSAIATALQALSLIFLGLLVSLSSAATQALRYDIYYIAPMMFIILAFSYQNGHLARLISARPLIVLGEASFAFYLIHQIVIRVGQAFRGRAGLPNHVGVDIVLSTVYLLAAVILSLIVFKYYERPANKFTKNHLLLLLSNVKAWTYKNRLP